MEIAVLVSPDGQSVETLFIVSVGSVQRAIEPDMANAYTITNNLLELNNMLTEERSDRLKALRWCMESVILGQNEPAPNANWMRALRRVMA